MQPNIGKLLILSVGFQLLFCVFNTAQNLASQVLDDLGFGNFGFYSLGVLYFAFAICCFVATPIVNSCGERFSMTLGALCYTLYTGSFILASAPIKYQEEADSNFFMSQGFIKFVILLTAAINGFGASILWVAQGRYLSRIANDTNKGTFNSIFWAFFMSTQIIGALFAAIVLQNTDAFTFYCIMTSICFFASLFFLFLQPVDAATTDNATKINSVSTQQQPQDYTLPQQEQTTEPVEAIEVHEQEEDEAAKTTMEDIKETFKMLTNKRMATLYPTMAFTAINLGIFASIFIKMMVDTMDDKTTSWSDQDKTSNALLCMLGLGSGEIIGSIAWGRITDMCSTKRTVLINTIATTIGYGCLILYAAIYEFSFPLGILMTFTWGVQDSGVNCLLNSILGFQFESKTTPFSVYKFLQSLLIFVMTCIASFTTDKQSYLIFFVACYIFAMVSWLVLFKYFNILTKEQVAEMRREARLNQKMQVDLKARALRNDTGKALLESSDLKTTLRTANFGGQQSTYEQ